MLVCLTLLSLRLPSALVSARTADLGGSGLPRQFSGQDHRKAGFCQSDWPKEHSHWQSGRYAHLWGASQGLRRWRKYETTLSKICTWLVVFFNFHLQFSYPLRLHSRRPCNTTSTSFSSPFWCIPVDKLTLEYLVPFPYNWSDRNSPSHKRRVLRKGCTDGSLS